MAPANAFMSVDLPAPFSPSRPTTSPGPMVMLTWSTARTGPKSTTMSFISTSIRSALSSRAYLGMATPGAVVRVRAPGPQPPVGSRAGSLRRSAVDRVPLGEDVARPVGVEVVVGVAGVADGERRDEVDAVSLGRAGVR